MGCRLEYMALLLAKRSQVLLDTYAGQVLGYICTLQRRRYALTEQLLMIFWIMWAAGTLKPNQDGVSCDDYCKASQGSLPCETCTAAWDLQGQLPVDCSTTGGTVTLCYCEQGKGKRCVLGIECLAPIMMQRLACQLAELLGHLIFQY